MIDWLLACLLACLHGQVRSCVYVYVSNWHNIIFFLGNIKKKFCQSACQSHMGQIINEPFNTLPFSFIGACLNNSLLSLSLSLHGYNIYESVDKTLPLIYAYFLLKIWLNINFKAISSHPPILQWENVYFLFQNKLSSSHNSIRNF